MKTLKTLIVDDEELARRGIEIRLAQYPDIEIVGQCRMLLIKKGVDWNIEEDARMGNIGIVSTFYTMEYGVFHIDKNIHFAVR